MRGNWDRVQGGCQTQDVCRDRQRATCPTPPIALLYPSPALFSPLLPSPPPSPTLTASLAEPPFPPPYSGHFLPHTSLHPSAPRPLHPPRRTNSFPASDMTLRSLECSSRRPARLNITLVLAPSDAALVAPPALVQPPSSSPRSKDLVMFVAELEGLRASPSLKVCG